MNALLLALWESTGDTGGLQKHGVVDVSRIYKQVMDNGTFLHWGDYTCYDHPEDYPGEVLVICQSGHLNGTLEWMAGCEYLGTFEGWDMYRMGENRIYPL